MMIDPDRWGMGNRINRCLAVLRAYGGAARSEVPRLRALAGELEAKRWKPDKIEALQIDQIIDEIENDPAPVELRSITALQPGV